MAINTEIERLQGAKADLKDKIEESFGTTIPSSEKLDRYKDYFIPAGCYASAPSANGVYIKYVGGFYSDYNVLWTGKIAVGVAVRTSSAARTLHPSETTTKKWAPNQVLVSGVTTTTDRSTALSDYDGKNNTDAILAAYPIDTSIAAYWAKNVQYADASTGWMPSAGEVELFASNETNVNYALNLIGGTQTKFSQQKKYQASTQYNANEYWLREWYQSTFWWSTVKTGAASTNYLRSVTDF